VSSTMVAVSSRMAAIPSRAICTPSSRMSRSVTGQLLGGSHDGNLYDVLIGMQAVMQPLQ
jgi:hypothetical protein